MKIAVTGGFGYAGTIIADYLHARGHAVRLLVHSPNPDLHDWSRRFEVVPCDVSDAASLKGTLGGCDAVIHLASLNETDSAKDPQRALLINAFGTRNMLDEAVTAGVARFIFVSTFHVYGVGVGKITESTPAVPLGDYALTHLFGEYYGLKTWKTAGLSVSVARLTNGYGAATVKSVTRWPLVVNDLCRAAHEKKKIVLKSSGVQKRDFIWLGDLGQACHFLLSATPEEVGGGIYNVGGDNSLSIREIAGKVQAAYRERHGEDLPIEAPEPQPGEMGRDVHVDIGKIKKLGFKPNNVLDAEIHRTFDLLEKAGR